jgi:hypothetical protein
MEQLHMLNQSQQILLTPLAMSLHSYRELEMQPSLSLDTLPPPTPDERSRVLCTHSRLLVWRAQRATETSKQLRARIQRRRQQIGSLNM